ncbi:MAG TPA: hypothetical protein VEF34_10525 [Syntrophobacteraceae bacterium]|nr:hypothetical protein [Syntrophobacteraceae bacterium]
MAELQNIPHRFPKVSQSLLVWKRMIQRLMARADDALKARYASRYGVFKIAIPDGFTGFFYILIGRVKALSLKKTSRRGDDLPRRFRVSKTA